MPDSTLESSTQWCKQALEVDTGNTVTDGSRWKYLFDFVILHSRYEDGSNVHYRRRLEFLMYSNVEP